MIRRGVGDQYVAERSANRVDLLQAVRGLGPEELDAFLEQVLALRKGPRTAVLSSKETRLMQQINRGIPHDIRTRYARLLRKRKDRTLTDSEREDLLKLTHEVETRDADRAAALVELAELRRVPVRMLMKDLGIRAAPVRG
jgi:hypothetical protein